IGILFTLVCAQPPDQPQADSYNQFKDDFAKDPLVTAQNHPQEYMKYISENPPAVKENPHAYVVVISQDVKYINQNKDAFKAFAETEDIKFMAIEGDFKSFDVETKVIETEGASGETVTSFSFKAIKAIEEKGGSNFKINDKGELTYQLAESQRSWENTITAKGKLEVTDQEVYLSEGEISVGDGASALFNIGLANGNRAKLLTPCSFNDEKMGCGIAEVEVVGSPISIPTGTLMQGKAIIVDDNEINLLPNSRFKNWRDFEFGVTTETRITEISGTPCYDVKYSCIQDNEPELLKVIAKDGNQIKIDGKDGVYKSIIVKQIQEIEPQVLVGEFGGKEIYITKRGTFVRADGSYDPEIMKYALEVQKHPNFATAKQAASNVPDEGTNVDLTLIKDDGSSARVVFSKNAPVSQGNLAGLKSNLGHVFEHDRIKYPWMVYQGVASDAKGMIDDLKYLPGVLGDMIVENRKEEAELLLKSVEKLDEYVLEGIMATIRDNPTTEDYGDLLSHILDAYPENDVKKIELLGIATDEKNPIVAKLQQKLLEGVTQVPSKDVTILLHATSGNEELQKLVLSKTAQIDDPGSALDNVNSDELRRSIIEKAQTIRPDYEFDKKYGTTAYLTDYLSAISVLSPELRQLAIDNLDFEFGVFYDETRRGEAYRTVLMAYKDKPEEMKQVLAKMPVRNDLGFNPKIFNQVYFDEEFQEQTKELDFANRYSVALTAQRYLERSGQPATPEKIQEVTNIIINQRAQFSNYVILDENTYYIPVTHEEKWFDNGEMVTLARDAGVGEVAASDFKGSIDPEKTKEVKERALGTIVDSKTHGKTTLHFSNHGSPDHQWLSSGQTSAQFSDDLHRPDAISYVELGDALADRGNLREVTVMIDSCHSADFKDKLYNYLNTKGITELPVIVTETNRGQLGWVTKFQKALEYAHQSGKPLTGADIYKIETNTFITQDLSITVPVSSDVAAQVANPATPGVLDMGSTYDEGQAEPPQKPAGKPAETVPTKTPPSTVIEIGQNEEEMEKRLMG
ncbi:hypothetical protein HZC30_04915, partial [Candidatus Woesearchaeota archaeon]|nr:hypothetical protein [Candidatus Woesearchaeota archaeon]